MPCGNGSSLEAWVIRSKPVAAEIDPTNSLTEVMLPPRPNSSAPSGSMRADLMKAQATSGAYRNPSTPP